MIKKITLLELEYEYAHDERYFITNKIPKKIVKKTPMYFNTGLIKYINTIKVQNKVIWQITLTGEEEIIYSEPFKM